MTQELILSQIIEPRDNFHRNRLLLEVLIFQKEKQELNSNIIECLEKIKTNNPSQIALIGLILWNEKINNFPNWKEHLLMLKVEHFWGLENSEEIKNAISQVPFELLVRIFWGLCEDDIGEIPTQSIAIFKDINLVTFTEVILFRKHTIMNDDLDYFYSRKLSLSENEVRSIENRYK